MADILLEIKDLKVQFPIRSTRLFGGAKKYLKAVDGVSFYIERGETLGLVGESGSGKTTLGRCILRAVEPTEGQIIFNVDGQMLDLAQLTDKEMRVTRKHMQLIFQDPYSSLNPRMTVRDIIAEPLVAQKLAKGQEIDERVRDAAELCMLNVEYLRRFPHAFSGGQRQRIGIARALISKPQFIVCDESVSALDVSIQADILNLLMDLQSKFGFTYLFIAHDLSVVAHISKRVAVMYLGQFVELAPTKELFHTPKHPYTEALMSAIPEMNPDQEMTAVHLEGEIPNPVNPPSGCYFHTRCPYMQDMCKMAIPKWQEIEKRHFVACHFAGRLKLKGVKMPDKVAKKMSLAK